MLTMVYALRHRNKILLLQKKYSELGKRKYKKQSNSNNL